MKTIILFACLSFLLFSCKKEENKGNEVYITGAANPVDLKIILNENPVIAYFTLSMVSPYPIPAQSGINNDVQVDLSIDEAAVQEYNTKNGKNYKLLPSNSYQLASKVVIPANSYVSDKIPLRISGLGKMEPFETYLLPIHIANVTGSVKDNTHQTLLYIVTGSLDAQAMPFLSRAKWTVKAVSSEEINGEGPNNGHAIHALDGDRGTFWHTQWQGNEPRPPHFITLDLGEKATIKGFSYVTRDFGANWPKVMEIEVSDDNVSWSKAALFDNLPAKGATEFRSFFAKEQQARYLKVNIKEVYGGPSTHVAEINLF